MTLLAILDAKDSPSHFSVTDLHVNLWSLAAFGGKRRSFVLDIGVRVLAADIAVDRISVAIPFATEEFECLHKKLTDSVIAGLIFNTDASANHSEVTLGNEVLAIYEVAQIESSKQKDYSNNDFSLWDLRLAKPIPAGSVGYFRVRFPVTGAGKAWQWQRQRLFRSGATIDLRVADGRSAASIKGGTQLMERVRPIDRLAVFVMVPAWMHGRTISPTPHYIRLLEGNLWKKYLDRSPEWRTRSRLIVYYWNNDSRKAGDSGAHESINPGNPFQIFNDFGIDAHPSRIITILATTLLTLVGVGNVYVLPVQDWVRDTAQFLSDSWADFFSEQWTVTNPFTLVLVLTGLVVGTIAFAQSSLRLAIFLRAKFLKLESMVFRMLSAR